MSTVHCFVVDILRDGLTEADYAGGVRDANKERVA